jgi:nucleoside-diphosphate-sugar epimerase
MNIFLAGATGVIGRRVLLLLRDAGHAVTGTTRSRDKMPALIALGAKPAVVDALDATTLARLMEAARPEVVIHQLTDLPAVVDPTRMAEALERNARLRIDGTRNLMAAARACGARRVIAQSIAFVYAAGQGPRRETDPLDSTAERAVTVEGVVSLEEQVLGAPGIFGLVLRYGRLYGPGTWFETPNGPGPLHVDAAAHAAKQAITRGAPGIYNIAEDDGAVSIEKARLELGFDPSFRLT